MREVNTVNSVFIGIQSHISPDSAPKTGTVNRYHVFGFSVYLTYENVQTIVFLRFFFVADRETIRIFCQSAIHIHQHVTLYIFIIFSIGIFHISDVQCRQNLLLGVQLLVFILNVFQRRADKCKQECHDNNHYRSINDSIRVTICIHLSCSV